MTRLGLLLCFGWCLAGCGHPSTPARPCDLLADGGACVPVPSSAAARTSCDGITRYCDAQGGGTPNLACLVAPDGGFPATSPGMPTRVTLTGFVRALESGPDTSGLTVQVIDPALLANGANPAFVQTVGGHLTTLDGAVACGDKLPACSAGSSCIAGHCWSRVAGVEPLQRACDRDLALGCVYALTDGCNHSCNDGLDGRRDDGQYCRDDGSGGSCRDRLRWEPRYTIDNVPTNRALVMRVSGAGGTANPTWAATVRWNVELATSARGCSSDTDSDCLDVGDAAHPLYRLDATALAQADWLRLPLQAGLGSGVPNGDGAILGEVHDCDDVRLANITIAVAPSAARVAYFTADPLVLRADITRAVGGTDPLGRFAAWGIHGGRVVVDAAGLVGGHVTAFGRDSLFVYGGTLSLVTVNGGRR